MERKIKRNKSDFLRSKQRKAIFFIFLLKKPKKSILELISNNPFYQLSPQPHHPQPPEVQLSELPELPPPLHRSESLPKESLDLGEISFALIFEVRLERTSIDEISQFSTINFCVRRSIKSPIFSDNFV